MDCVEFLKTLSFLSLEIIISFLSVYIGKHFDGDIAQCNNNY